MSVRLRYKLSIAVSSTTAELNDLGNVEFEVVSDDNADGGAWKTSCPANATTAINLDGITTGTFLSLRFTTTDPTQTLTQVLVTINGTATLPVFPTGLDAKEALFVITSTGVTSVSVANLDPASVPLDCIVALCGT